MEKDELKILYEKKMTCPHCNNAFYTTKVKNSKNVVVESHTDFNVIYKFANPYIYDTNVCIHCGFAYMDKTTELTKTQNFQIKSDFLNKLKEIPDYCGERTPDTGIKLLKIALHVATIIKEEKSVIAGICMRLAWMYRAEGNKKEENRFLENAMNLYERIYSEGDKHISDVAYIAYLTGDLAIRLDNYNKAKQFFGLLFTYGGSSPEQKKLVDKGRDLWQDFKATKESSFTEETNE